MKQTIMQECPTTESWTGHEAFCRIIRKRDDAIQLWECSWIGEPDWPMSVSDCFLEIAMAETGCTTPDEAMAVYLPWRLKIVGPHEKYPQTWWCVREETNEDRARFDRLVDGVDLGKESE